MSGSPIPAPYTPSDFLSLGSRRVYSWFRVFYFAAIVFSRPAKTTFLRVVKTANVEKICIIATFSRPGSQARPT